MKTKAILATLGVACFSLVLGACGYDKEAEETSQPAAETEMSGSMVEDIQESAGSMVEGVEETISETMAEGQEKVDETMEGLMTDVEGEADKLQDEVGKLPQ